MWRSIASNALTMLIVLVFLLGGLVLWGKEQYTAEGPLTEAICLRVPSGGRLSNVSEDLLETGAVSSAGILRIGADYTKKTNQLKAGSFLVPAGSSMEEIVDIITRGGANSCGTEIVYRIGVTRASVQVRELDPATNRYIERAEFDPTAETEVPEEFTKVRARTDTRYRIAMAEGVTSWQVVDVLKAVEVLEGEIDGIPPEGTLAPNSYEVQTGGDRQALIDRMTSAQAAILEAAWQDRDDDLPYDSPAEALIMASIIEKETGVPDERTQVASVFVNRLRRGMRLQTDPTVIYGITNGEGVLGRGLRRSELDRVTPYNTYAIDGLPPTPIANPGKAAIEAAMQPASTDFVYFVADGTGGHAFATTLAEHNSNVAKWRQIEAERAGQ
ncbi:endolytic transglycosylase MltG [Pseudooceanicola sp.]|uniref:endolytic transglycosylase MltG n=1 Tax=Pseudooceanicola sp. TaxID=1914328 RepID=UPI000C099852|nr:branched-chain alpha-keto acid dehydrogenase subunit E2 [Pseudooceanicola sp.]